MARGLCSTHYARWRRNGHTDLVRETHLPLSVRFWRLVDVRGPNDCWPWTGSVGSHGYGIFSYGNGPTKGGTIASRWAYLNRVGPLDDDQVAEHTCHTNSTCPGGPTCLHRRCCNPAHLVPLTVRENVLVGRGISATNATKTTCTNGHAFDKANTRTDPRTGDRVCRACARARLLAYRTADPDGTRQRQTAAQRRYRARKRAQG